MKKVMVIGCPGSGKSHFSRILHKKTKLPLYHLDMMYWRADRTTVGRDEFRARLQKVLAEDAWIIDGNYASTMELRLAACDTVILLDYPTEICLDGIRERRGKPRDDMPWVETDEDEELVDLVMSSEVISGTLEEVVNQNGYSDNPMGIPELSEADSAQLSAAIEAYYAAGGNDPEMASQLEALAAILNLNIELD